MTKRFLRPTLLFVCSLLFAISTYAQTPASGMSISNPASQKPLVVGIKVAPPFVMQDNGQYYGLAIDLWQEVAADHGWRYTYKPYDLEGLLDAVQHHKVDVGLGAITATAQREQRVDFAHPITSSGLGVAVRNKGGSGWRAVIRVLVSSDFLEVIGSLIPLLLGVGILIWSLEHKHNPEQFGGNKRQGIFSGFWWAIVTMTTVGYGDTAPRSVPGRLLGMMWMLAALIIVSFFTASITSALTVGQLSHPISSAEDLSYVRVVSIANSTSGHWLERNHDHYAHVDSLDDAFRWLIDGKADAVVYDAPLLSWKIRQHYSRHLQVLPIRLERQDYAFALPEDSLLREQIDTSLLQRINAPDWNRRLEKYFGTAR